MAVRVSKGIQREAQKLSKLLAQYNSLRGPDHEEVTWSQVTDLSSSLWSDNQIEPHSHNDIEVPRHIQLAAINALQKKNRAIEEKELIKREMLNTINCYNFIEIYQALIQRRLSNPQICSKFELGCKFLPHKKVEFYKGELEATMKAFKDYIEIPSFDHIHDITNDDQEIASSTSVINLSPSSFITPDPASLVEKRAGMFTTSITSNNLSTKLILIFRYVIMITITIMYTNIRIYSYVIMCVYICIYVCMYVYVCTYVCTYMYVRMYVRICMYVCMYVRTYVCMYVRTYVCMYVCMYVCTYVCMYVCMYVRMYVCMYVCTYVCMLHVLFMYVCMYVCNNQICNCTHTHAHTHAHAHTNIHAMHTHIQAQNSLLIHHFVIVYLYSTCHWYTKCTCAIFRH